MAGTVSTYVEVDIDDVLSEISDDHLREEMASRGMAAISSSAFGGDAFMRDLEEAARAGRAFDLLDIVQRALPPLKSPCRQTPYDQLKRDPETGRPVIQ